MSRRFLRMSLFSILIIAALNSCKVYLYDVNAIRESNTKQEAAFNAGVARLNEKFFKQAATPQQHCDLQLVLELIANTKADYEKIVIDEATADEIARFLNDGYGKLKSGKISSYTIKSMEDKLNHILSQLFDKGKQNNNIVNKTVLEQLRDAFCPLDPFC